MRRTRSCGATCVGWVGDKLPDGLGVKIAAEALELGRDGQCVGPIELLGRLSSAAPGPAHSGMSGQQLIELVRSAAFSAQRAPGTA